MARTGHKAVLTSVWRSRTSQMTKPATNEAAMLRRQRSTFTRRVALSCAVITRSSILCLRVVAYYATFFFAGSTALGFNLRCLLFQQQYEGSMQLDVPLYCRQGAWHSLLTLSTPQLPSSLCSSPQKTLRLPSVFLASHRFPDFQSSRLFSQSLFDCFLPLHPVWSTVTPFSKSARRRLGVMLNMSETAPRRAEQHASVQREHITTLMPSRELVTDTRAAQAI
ncbi:hypothetical protein CONLIGDRAFT_289112 [Coniochaeta ligniaria NRRL 30616]|uniref:Uncharacterized protein n=1 Tax=Coniochaeta ligniaria NRRL 30616 TaxID=1408157 RepID=A0A1J7JN34_9PEZI|nr:hypothetical protein CONLIGDRAFT_289112 [Coniochaeta ligniaria NRRL 30616]